MMLVSTTLIWLNIRPVMLLLPFDLRAKSFFIATVFNLGWCWTLNCGIFVLQFNFQGIISSCFEPHMTVYVELEEKTLMEHLEKLVQVCLINHIKCSSSWSYLELASNLCSFHRNRMKHGKLRREVRLIYCPVACR